MYRLGLLRIHESGTQVFLYREQVFFLPNLKGWIIIFGGILRRQCTEFLFDFSTTIFQESVVVNVVA